MDMNGNDTRKSVVTSTLNGGDTFMRQHSKQLMCKVQQPRAVVVGYYISFVIFFFFYVFVYFKYLFVFCFLELERDVCCDDIRSSRMDVLFS